MTGSPALYLSSIVLCVSASYFLPMFTSPFPEIVTRATVLHNVFPLDESEVFCQA